MIYLKLFLSFFQVGLFGIGGGYAALPLIQEQIVGINHWLTVKEFTDLVTISQMTPGSMTISSATFVGIRTAGIPGAILATFSCVLPSCVIAITLAYLYGKYRRMALVQGVLESLRPAVVSLIAAAGLPILFLAFFNSESATTFFKNAGINIPAMIIFGVALAILRKFKKVDPIYVLLGSGVVGALVYLLV